ncbi:RES domain-containing protein [Crateriforma conspicua]|uniref:Uncharacterized protein n=1 Tax=Crateriforma conspicua TaxID=2527996 RepID=A0A5C5YAF9_9PLAN|nr:RES domain-containing protein [Crateriforma conspicua]TWT72667.1 hypothetical protein Pan14r_49870 [Crateriforma conspicua]
MDNDQFYNNVKTYLGTCDRADIVTPIPQGSGVFHIANVLPERFDAAWVSQNAGRFSDDGEKVRYYANEFDVSAREIGYPPGSDPSGVVFIAAELTEPTNAIDVHKLSGEIKNELYADKDPATKWQKSHLFMQAVREDERFSDIRGAYFPSASGQALGTGGSCLALFDEPIPTNIIGSGDYAWWKSQQNVS